MRNFFPMIAAVSLVFATFQSVAQDRPEIIDLDKGSFYMVNGVNVRNGNFAVTYITGSSIPFDRTYNSRSTYPGLFGLGWGSKFETRMLYMPDGTAIVHENGTGNYAVYSNSNDQTLARVGIDRIIESAKRQDPSISVDDMRRKLSASPGARFDAVAKYGPLQSFPEGVELAVDRSTIFESSHCQNSSIRRPAGSNVASRAGCDNGLVEAFGPDGYLTSVGKGGNINIPSVMKIEKAGPVITKLTDENGKVTTFKYDAKHQLVRQDYPSGEWQAFAYDAHGNMTSITYLDNSKQIITYDDKDRATSVTKRTGETAKFEYLQDPYNPSVSLTRATVKTDAGDRVIVFKMQD